MGSPRGQTQRPVELLTGSRSRHSGPSWQRAERTAQLGPCPSTGGVGQGPASREGPGAFCAGQGLARDWTGQKDLLCPKGWPGSVTEGQDPRPFWNLPQTCCWNEEEVGTGPEGSRAFTVIHTHTHREKYTHSHTETCSDTCMHSQTHRQPHPYTHTQTHFTMTHTSPYTDIHTHAYADACTFTERPPLRHSNVTDLSPADSSPPSVPLQGPLCIHFCQEGNGCWDTEGAE